MRCETNTKRQLSKQGRADYRGFRFVIMFVTKKKKRKKTSIVKIKRRRIKEKVGIGKYHEFLLSIRIMKSNHTRNEKEMNCNKKLN